VNAPGNGLVDGLQVTREDITGHRRAGHFPRGSITRVDSHAGARRRSGPLPAPDAGAGGSAPSLSVRARVHRRPRPVAEHARPGAQTPEPAAVTLPCASVHGPTAAAGLLPSTPASGLRRVFASHSSISATASLMGL